MEKTNKRVPKRLITLSALAILLATLTTGSSAEENVESVVDFRTVAYNAILDRAFEQYENSLEQKRIAEQKLIEEEEERAKAKAIAETKAEEDRKAAEAKTKVKEKAVSYSEEDLYWLSRVVSSESKGESEEGQIAVANVVLNRVNSEEFEDTIKGVVFQKKQFSGVYDKSIYKEPTKEAIESAIKALEGERVVDEDVYYFYNPKIATSRWLDTREVAVDIGNHRFTY